MNNIQTSPHESQLLNSKKFIIFCVVFFAALSLLWLYSKGSLYFIGGLSGLLLIGLILLRPHLGTYIVILSFPFLSAIPRGAYVPGLKLDEVLIIAFLGLALISPKVRDRLRVTRIDLAYLYVFLAGSLLPFLGVQYREENPDWVEAVALLKPMAIYHLVSKTLNSRHTIVIALIFLLLSSFAVAIIAGLQLLNFLGLRTLLAQLYFDSSAPLLVARSNYFRATSTLGNWNALGGYAVLGACLSLSILSYGRTSGFKLFASLALAINVCILLFAGSASSIIGFVIGLLAWRLLTAYQKRRLNLFGYKKLVPIVLLVIFGGAAFYFVGKDVLLQQLNRQVASSYVVDLATGNIYPTYGLPSSVVVRWALAKYLIGVLAEDRLAIFVGFGPGRTGLELLPTNTAESGYMVMWFSSGIFFVIAYLFLYKEIYTLARRLLRRLTLDDYLGLVLAKTVLVMTVVLIAINLVHAYYTAAGVIHYYWIVVACMISFYKILLKEQNLNRTPEKLVN